MPCDMIATCRAKVSNETIAKLLTREMVDKVVEQFMKDKGIQNWGYSWRWSNGVLTSRDFDQDQLDEIVERLDQLGIALLALKAQEVAGGFGQTSDVVENNGTYQFKLEI